MVDRLHNQQLSLHNMSQYAVCWRNMDIYTVFVYLLLPGVLSCKGVILAHICSELIIVYLREKMHLKNACPSFELIRWDMDREVLWGALSCTR